MSAPASVEGIFSLCRQSSWVGILRPTIALRAGDESSHEGAANPPRAVGGRQWLDEQRSQCGEIARSNRQAHRTLFEPFRSSALLDTTKHFKRLLIQSAQTHGCGEFFYFSALCV